MPRPIRTLEAMNRSASISGVYPWTSMLPATQNPNVTAAYARLAITPNTPTTVMAAIGRFVNEKMLSWR